MAIPTDTLNNKKVMIPGPMGDLEAIVSTSSKKQAHRVIVICHPHPLHDGTMNNKVVHYLAKTCANEGFVTVRFNFRGVGESAGSYGEGEGETEDVLAVCDWLQKQSPEAALWLAGFSFGAYTALKASTQRNVEALITIAPAVNRLNFSTLTLPHCPWLVIHGAEDEIVPYSDVITWAKSQTTIPDIVCIKSAGHFFHGRLNDIRQNVHAFLKTTLSGVTK